MLNIFNTNKENEKSNKTYLFAESGFSLDSLKPTIEDAFVDSKTEDYKFNSTSNNLTIDFNIKEEKKKISSSRFRFIHKNTIIHVFSESVSLSQEDYKETVTPSKINIRKDNTFKAIQNYILTKQNDNLYAFDNKESIPFIQDTDSLTKNYIFHQIKDQEYVLSILNISSISFNNEEEIPKDISWRFVLTSLRTLLIGTSENDFFTTDISKEKIEINEKTGKDSISGTSFTFLTELMNDSDYVALLPAINSTSNRLNSFADCLLKKYNNKTKYIKLASTIYGIEHQQSGYEIHQLKSELIKYLEGFKIKKKQEEQITCLFKKRSANTNYFGEYLIEISRSWNLDYDILEVFSKILFLERNDLSIKNSISYQNHFKNLFLNKEKKEESIFEFNLNHGKALAKSGFYKDGIGVYKNIYKTLPDDSIIDLLPTNKTNILKGESGQQLKITILESILKWQEEGEINTSETTLKLTQLQPLLNDRIDALKKHPKHKEKAETISSILNFKNTKHETIAYQDHQYDKLVKQDVLEDIVPECFKNAKGFFDSLNGYIATIKQPNYDAVISFSDKLNTQNYPNIYKSITNICYALKIDTPECYIGRANYANSVIGIEGKPPYLIIGINFLQESHTKRLNYNEITFLIAIELAHIYFEHSKITATDVWRGAAEKGFSIVSVLLTLLPFAGSIGAMLGNFSHIDKYAKIVNSVEKASNVAEKGQNIMEVGEKLNINLLSKDKRSSNSQDLLITSRLMEIIADKVALLFCNDLHPAIKSIIRSSNSFEKELPNIEKYGLYKLLERTNEDDEFYHQETIIRIKSLCSFYLTDTYEDLKNKLYL